MTEILTFEETRKYLRVHRMTLYRLAQEGKIPASKVGRQWRFKKDKLDRWLDEQEVAYRKKR